MSIDHIPEYFAKPGVTEALAETHPTLLVRQMANEILRLRSARPEEGPSWISVKDRLPDLGIQVITHHFLGRVDMLTFDGTNFNFPLTCPVDADGRPLGFTASYPLEAITHWMRAPSPMNSPPAAGAATKKEPS